MSALHQPGGAPNLGENGLPAGPDTAAAVYPVEGRDAFAGYYEAVAVATNERAVSASMEVDHAPVSVWLLPGHSDSLSVSLTSLVDSAVSGRLDLGLVGGEGSLPVAGSGGDDVTVGFALPSWTWRMVLDLGLDPAQWPRFTDLGFREPWKGRVTVRLEADRPTAISTAGADEFTLSARGSTIVRGLIGATPWKLPEGFAPFAIVIAESAGIPGIGRYRSGGDGDCGAVSWFGAYAAGRASARSW